MLANQLDVIETELNTTDGELTEMRRRSVDILMGSEDSLKSYGMVEKKINDLAAKKQDLVTKRFETYMNLQGELMAPGGEPIVDKNQYNANEDLSKPPSGQGRKTLSLPNRQSTQEKRVLLLKSRSSQVNTTSLLNVNVDGQN